MHNAARGFSGYRSFLERASAGIDVDDVPSLKHQIVYGGGHRLVCEKTGLIWDASDTTIGSNSINGGKTLARVQNSNGVYYTTTNMTGLDFPINLKSGSWSTFSGTKVWLFIVAGRVLSNYAARVAIGDQNQFLSEYALIEAGFGLSDGAPDGTGLFHSAIFTPDMYITPPSVYETIYTSNSAQNELSNPANTNKDVATYGLYVPGDGIEYKSIEVSGNGTPVIAADVDAPGSILTVPGDFTANPCMRFSGYGLYGFWLYEFSAKPADIYAAIQWHAAAASRYGIIEPYPGWIGRNL